MAPARRRLPPTPRPGPAAGAGRAAPGWAGALLLALLLGGPPGPVEGRAAAADPPPPGGVPVERYPASWRLRVAQAIERGAEALRLRQEDDGRWGPAGDPQALGHTSLVLLTLRKAGLAADDPCLERAQKHVDALPIDKVYAAGCYLMALAARYHATLDTFDTDVGASRAARVDPAAVRARLTPAHAARFEAGVAFLVAAQTADGLWSYGVQEGGGRAYDLSNNQYALLGLRAAADSGIAVPEGTWTAALRGLLAKQDADGPRADLVTHEVRDGYAFARREAARARPFRYVDTRRDGPLGKATVPTWPATGSMTTSGLAGLAICREGLWRSRRFGGRDRKLTEDALRDGLAWLQEHFAVDVNPGMEAQHHLYYLYGLERLGMLVERRWLGAHDWYREGADLLLAQQREDGSWGDHVDTAFAVLFLKRATSPPAVAVSGG